MPARMRVVPQAGPARPRVARAKAVGRPAARWAADLQPAVRQVVARQVAALRSRRWASRNPVLAVRRRSACRVLAPVAQVAVVVRAAAVRKAGQTRPTPPHSRPVRAAIPRAKASLRDQAAVRPVRVAHLVEAASRAVLQAVVARPEARMVAAVPAQQAVVPAVQARTAAAPRAAWVVNQVVRPAACPALAANRAMVQLAEPVRQAAVRLEAAKVPRTAAEAVRAAVGP